MSWHCDISRKPGRRRAILTNFRDLGAAVRHSRRDAGLSQQELADRARVSRQWLSRLESGKSPASELQKVLDLFTALGLAIELTAAPPPAPEDQDPFTSLFGDQS